MKAQKLYDFREKTAFCSGTELHKFFNQQVGDPSPSGDIDINDDAATSFVTKSLAEMEQNSPSMADECLSIRQDWKMAG